MLGWNHGQVHKIHTPSTSQQCNRLKKSSSSTSSKNPLSSSMTGAVHSKKNHKTLADSQKSRSYKALGDVTTSLNMSKNITAKKETINQKSQKKQTIPIKNLKQKAVGMKTSQCTVTNVIKSTTTMNAPKNNKIIHKKQTIKKNMQSYYCPTKDPKKNVTSREQLTNSVISFTQNSIQGNHEQNCLSMQMFEVGRKLGKGRFGDVYMTKQIKTGFLFAIKMINKRELKQSEMQKQLIQEIKIQMFCNHPNLLKMYGFFHDKTKIYLLLELATNGCLFKQIRNKGYMLQNVASFYFRQVLNAVKYLHNHCIIHRDIKPQNILNCFNVLKMCDFGWSIYSPLYQRQTFCGTLDYVPPEIVTGEFYDEKADLWCLGVLCYQICTGKAPFESKNDENQTYDKILSVNIEFPIYLSPQIVQFIGKILNRQPSKRISLEQAQSHEWMRKYENQAGRMISKDVWDSWVNLSKA